MTDAKSGVTPPPGADDGFLSRWSRRKRAIAAGEASQDAPADAVRQTADMPAAAGEGTGAVQEEGATTGQALSEAEKAEAAQRELDELIARLPKIEEITAATDITGFMDSRIPDMLRNAALRAAWTADPAIRDFVNDAREYALDYNTPGAAPGYGLLSESERAQAAEFVKSLFSGPKPEVSDHTFGAENPCSESEISDQESQPAIAASQHAARAAEPSSSVRLSDRGQVRMEIAENASFSRPDTPSGAWSDPASDAGDQAASSSAPSVFRRRGGGALPV